MMFRVQEHGFGRKGHTMPDGQIWEDSLEGHEWHIVGDYSTKARAIEVAKAIPHHAIAHKTSGEFKTIFDNGKPPRNRIDWTRKGETR